jgi:hypothetical protein
MASLDRNLRRDLENAVKKARRVAEAGARQAVEQLAVGHHEPWSALSPDQRKLRNRLRAHGRQLGDKHDEKKGTQTIERLTGECAYEHWHRLLFARFLAENDLLVEPESGMALSLDECRELAREQSKDWLVLASEFAQRMLPQIFRAGDPVLEVALPPEKRQELEAILEGLPREVFIADDSLGWVYQFWQADQKDAVNASENKIGADELPAVTQLFTEDYMVLFLLHNTLGAWWAGKVLAAKPDLARSAASEDECRAACGVQGIEWGYLRFVREGDVWRPAAGTFPGWPTAAKDLTVLDPCMGSGHFLAFALPMLVALRQAEEKLSVAEAVDAVLRDNLFGLELDPRCTQIAAFHVGLTAWKLAGYRPLPALNLACAGLAINAPVAAWTALAAGDALAENAMKQLYELFRQAPTLGSLIDPTRVGGELFVANFDKVAPLLAQALQREGDDERVELAVAARGVAAAAQLLARRYTLVITNVPYLGRAKQDVVLAGYSDTYHHDSRADLATTFVDRICRALVVGGTTAVVTPQNWLFLERYKKLRERLLKQMQWNGVVWLGARAFETISGEVVKAILVTFTSVPPPPDHRLLAVDASDQPSAAAKARDIQTSTPNFVLQKAELNNPDSRIVAQVSDADLPLLSTRADAYQGIITGDRNSFIFSFWELPSLTDQWEPFVDAFEDEQSGRESVIRWEQGAGRLHRVAAENRDRLHDMHESGRLSWGRRGVLLTRIGLKAAPYFGERYDNNLICITPKNAADLEALWAFCSSDEYKDLVRELDRKLSLTNATACKVAVRLGDWAGEAQFPNPVPDQCTQWTFDGRASGCDSPLQVAVARLLGYRWPRQTGSSFMDCPAVGPDGLDSYADDDGIVCLPSLRGEAPAAERVRALLADAFGADWSAQKLNELLANANFAGRSLDDWLRDGFFEQHCALFHQRPFVWQIWDGRKDGFSALVNYHQLAALNGEGCRVLDKLTHTYLGDWLDRQRADQKAGVDGADGRVAAAEHLKRELEKILEGEPPYDLFVRWKPLHQQPVGWEPDIDDGVRVNIRPFMTAKPLSARGKNACILRVAPKIKWDKDRGKEPTREKADFPWFWGWDESTQDFAGGKEFDGNRWNDLHYARAAKLAARERAKRGKS